MISSERYQKKLTSTIKNVISSYFLSKTRNGRPVRNKSENSYTGSMIILTEFSSAKQEDTFRIVETAFGPNMPALAESRSSLFSQSSIASFGELSIRINSTAIDSPQRQIINASWTIRSTPRVEDPAKLSSGARAAKKTVRFSFEGKKKRSPSDTDNLKSKVYPKEKFPRNIKAQIGFYEGRNVDVPCVKEVILKSSQKHRIEELVNSDEEYQILQSLSGLSSEETLTERPPHSAEEISKAHTEQTVQFPFKFSTGVREKIAFFEKKAQESRERNTPNRFVVNLYESDLAGNLYENSAVEEESAEPLYDVVMEENEETGLGSRASESNECYEEASPATTDSDYASTTPTDSQSEFSSESTTSETPLSNKMQSLLKELHQQASVIKQVEKAIEVYRRTQHFIDEETLAAANKISIIAGLKQNILMKNWQKMEDGYTEMRSFSTASISVSDLAFPLKNMPDRDTFRTVYLITCTGDSFLYASDLLEADSEQNCLKLQEPLVFNRLSSDFVVDVNVYQLRIPIEKYEDSSIRRGCLLRRSKRTKKPCPAFSLCGSLQLTRESIRNESFLLDNIADDSTLLGRADLKSRITNLAVQRDHCGFLSVGTEVMGRLVWDRKWCRLENTVLNFWDNPSEELFNSPRIAINLEQCRSDRVEVAGKNLCSRSRTLTLSGVNFNATCASNNGTVTETQYFLTADSTEAMNVWKNRLNSVLTVVKFWQ